MPPRPTGASGRTGAEWRRRRDAGCVAWRAHASIAIWAIIDVTTLWVLTTWPSGMEGRLRGNPAGVDEGGLRRVFGRFRRVKDPGLVAAAPHAAGLVGTRLRGNDRLSCHARNACNERNACNACNDHLSRHVPLSC